MATARSATVVSLDRELLLSQAHCLEHYLHERQLIKDRKYRLRNYKSCFIGSEVILPIINLQFASNEQQAIQFGNNLINAGIMAHVESEHKFRNQQLFYCFLEDLSTAVDVPTLRALRNQPLSAPNLPAEDSIFQSQNQTLAVRGGGGNTGISPQRSYTQPAVSTHLRNGSDSSDDLYTNHPVPHPSQVTRAPVIHNAQHSSGTPRQHAFTNPNHFFSDSPSSPIQITQIQMIQSLQTQIQNLQQQIQAMSTKYFTLELTMTSLREQVEHDQRGGGVPMPGSPALLPSEEGSMATSPMNDHDHLAVEHVTPMSLSSSSSMDDDAKHEKSVKKEEVMVKTPPLLNKWIHFGDTYSQFAVYKIGAIVYLQGCLKGGLINAIVCQLPTDCRPRQTMTFCFDQHNAINGRLRILNNGNVFPEFMNKAWIYLDGISFVVQPLKINQPRSVQGQAVIENMTPKLENKWIEFGAGYASFKAYKCGNVVYLEGCVKNGAMNSTVATLPVQCRPSGTVTFCTDQHGGVNGRIRIFSNGRIVPEFMTKGWVYLDGISFVCS